ncbi:MAG: beta-glucosidase BglX [Bacteroidales bacterium]|nr:beta-glucosidase BglX [Bacteroidales bacterium]
MKKILTIGALALALFSLNSCSQKSEMDRFIDDLMGKMSVEEKIGQLNLHSMGFRSSAALTDDNATVKALKEGQMGALYGFGGSPETMRQLQDFALQGPHGIPLIFGMDVIHGFQTIFPVPLAISNTWNTDLVEKYARVAAKEATAGGINWVFSPMVDICHDARWGRIVEGAGEDPYLGGEMAKAMVYGYQGHDDVFDETEVLACVKHYALYGAAEAGRDYNTVNLGRQEILNNWMRPYADAAAAGAASYMSSFNEFEGIPVSANHYLLTELLRDTYGFDGFVVSDATAVQEMVAHGIGDLQEVSARALQAGLDMDMNSDGFVGTLKKSLDEGRVSIKDIDKACRRILEAKYKLGLFEDPYKYIKGERTDEIFSDENRALAREVAQESQVLLKNSGILPLSKDAKIALVGPFADNASDMSGAWAMSARASDNVTILQGIREALEGHKGTVSYAAGSKATAQPIGGGFGVGFTRNEGRQNANAKPQPTQAQMVAEAVAIARRSDVIVACVGEPNAMSGEGSSRADISIPEIQQEFIAALKDTGKPIVLVLTTGRPLTIVWEDENLDAILNTWALGTEAGHAIADVLFGDANPSGKLTTSFPREVGQLPLYYNHKNTGRPHPDYEPYRKFTSCYMDVINAPLYPFGYGLSYTTFEYSGLSLSSDSMPMDGKVTVSVNVKNTGKYDGKETVQLYIHDVVSTSTRPVKELRGFKKIFLKAGESQTVTFDLTAEDLKYYNHALEYVSEPGDFEIMVGTNSRDTETVLLSVK